MYLMGGYGPDEAAKTKEDERSSLSSPEKGGNGGGNNGQTGQAQCRRFNDVWRSSDGASWTRIRHVDPDEGGNVLGAGEYKIIDINIY